MPNRANCCFTNLSESTVQQVCKSYLTQSQAAVCRQFGITRYALLRIIKNAGIQRDRYGDERNKMVSRGIKKTLADNPDIVQQRTVKYHLGAKRSSKSCEKMQKSAWKRMQNQQNKYVSKIEIAFGYFVEKKLNIKTRPQYRVEGKPFDFLFEDKLLVEFDGPHHYDSGYFLWKNQPGGYEKQQLRDRLRHDIAKRNGYRLLVIRKDQVDRKGRINSDLMHCIMKELGHECA